MALFLTADTRTRQRVLEAAVSILAREGLSSSLLRTAAENAGCSIERAEIFFRRDEDLVLALYARLAAELEARVPDLPPGNLSDRFRAIMLAKLELVTPYREALAALLATLLDPRHELGALNEQTEIIRARVLGVFSAVVLGARDRKKMQAPALARSLYAVHLALMLLWTQDRNPESVATRNGIDLVCDMLALSGKLSWLPNLNDGLAKLDALAAPFVEPPPDEGHTATSIKILRQLFRHRRLLPDAGACAADPCEQCLALHLPKVRRAITAGEPLHFLLPSFPAKSPSPRKVLGRLPDMAEELALRFLDRVCDEIKDLYAPGARITICSDGLVFSDLVAVSDKDVADYAGELRALLDRIGARSLDTFGLEDLYGLDDRVAMREQLCANYAVPLEAVVERARTVEHHRHLFNGIQRFLFEDRTAIESEKSRTQLRTECKERAYQVIQRSDAWGRLIDDCFPTALRLSIHPQDPHSQKIGILLGDADDCWITPWHGVALKAEGKFKFMPRHQAEALGARLVEERGRPSYYQIGDDA